MQYNKETYYLRHGADGKISAGAEINLLGEIRDGSKNLVARVVTHGTAGAAVEAYAEEEKSALLRVGDEYDQTVGGVRLQLKGNANNYFTIDPA